LHPTYWQGKIWFCHQKNGTSVPPRRINEIVHQKRSITADTALRLGVFFNMSPHFWMNLQSRFEIEKAEDLLNEPDNIF
jgi:plasmid maintenance system antidote protein VapI